MHIKAVALALPTPGHWITLRSHNYHAEVSWGAGDRAEATKVLELIRSVYEHPHLALNDPNPEYRPLYNPDIKLDEALTRTYPVLISAHRANRSYRVLEEKRDRVSALQTLGNPDDDYGYHHIIIHRGARLSPTEKFIREAAHAHGIYDPVFAHVERDNDGLITVNKAKNKEVNTPWYRGLFVVSDEEPERYIDLSSLEVRTNPDLLALVRNQKIGNPQQLCHSGRFKVVMVPNEKEPVLMTQKGGSEVVVERRNHWQ